MGKSWRSCESFWRMVSYLWNVLCHHHLLNKFEINISYLGIIAVPEVNLASLDVRSSAVTVMTKLESRACIQLVLVSKLVSVTCTYLHLVNYFLHKYDESCLCILMLSDIVFWISLALTPFGNCPLWCGQFKWYSRTWGKYFFEAKNQCHRIVNGTY